MREAKVDITIPVDVHAHDIERDISSKFFRDAERRGLKVSLYDVRCELKGYSYVCTASIAGKDEDIKEAARLMGGDIISSEVI